MGKENRSRNEEATDRDRPVYHFISFMTFSPFFNINTAISIGNSS
jgi:hypothetical protein